MCVAHFCVHFPFAVAVEIITFAAYEYHWHRWLFFQCIRGSIRHPPHIHIARAIDGYVLVILRTSAPVVFHRWKMALKSGCGIDVCEWRIAWIFRCATKIGWSKTWNSRHRLIFSLATALNKTQCKRTCSSKQTPTNALPSMALRRTVILIFQANRNGLACEKRKLRQPSRQKPSFQTYDFPVWYSARFRLAYHWNISNISNPRYIRCAATKSK